MMDIFNIIAVPLGYVLWFIYRLVTNYFVAIFIFTLLVRLLMFPLSLKSQKSQAERARLAPRLERLQKKYQKDPQKLQQKQMELYEKEGVKMTAGCLPMAIQFILLFGIISVIYSPLTHLSRIPSAVVNAAAEAVTMQTDDDGNLIQDPNKVTPQNMTGYYRELRTLMVLENNEADIKAAIAELDDATRENRSADEYYEQMLSMKQDFRFGNRTLLENPWNGFGDINWLWVIPLFSWLTALGSSLISLRYTKLATGNGEKQPGQGCSTFAMVFAMPLFSLIVTFTVPGGVGIYWICSNLIAIVQTIVLNTIYNPVKIRAQAEAEYEERRRKKAEDKKRLAESRAREQEEARRLAKEEAEAAEEARRQASEKKPVSASRNPNKKKRRAQAQEETDTAVQPAAETPAPSETTPDSAQGTEGPANEVNTGDQPQA